MLNLKNKSIVRTHVQETHCFTKLEVKAENIGSLVSEIAALLPDHYLGEKAMRGLKKNKAAKKLRAHLPETRQIQSGDLGEILATDYTEEYTGYVVPIRKLRYKTSRNMPAYSEDAIGVRAEEQNETLELLKVEAKSGKRVDESVLKKARQQLDDNGGKISVEGLSMVASRLREDGRIKLGNKLDDLWLEGDKQDKVEHLLFVLTELDEVGLQKKALETYTGTISQLSVGVHVSAHQKLIGRVYQREFDERPSR